MVHVDNIAKVKCSNCGHDTGDVLAIVGQAYNKGTNEKPHDTFQEWYVLKCMKCKQQYRTPFKIDHPECSKYFTQKALDKNQAMLKE